MKHVQQISQPKQPVQAALPVKMKPIKPWKAAEA